MHIRKKYFLPQNENKIDPLKSIILDKTEEPDLAIQSNIPFYLDQGFAILEPKRNIKLKCVFT